MEDPQSTIKNVYKNTTRRVSEGITTAITTSSHLHKQVHKLCSMNYPKNYLCLILTAVFHTVCAKKRAAGGGFFAIIPGGDAGFTAIIVCIVLSIVGTCVRAAFFGEDEEESAVVDPSVWLEKQRRAQALMELHSRNLGTTETRTRFNEFTNYNNDDNDMVGGSSRRAAHNPTQVVPMVMHYQSKQEEHQEQNLIRKQALEKIETVRVMLARRLKDDKKFLHYLNKIDKDENGSINGKEFSKLLVKVKKRDHHHSDNWILTNRIAGISWAAALRDEALMKGLSGDENLKSKELTFAAMRRWIFPVPLEPRSLRNWEVEEN